MEQTCVGVRFTASLLKAWPPKDVGELLLEVDLTATQGPIKCSHTGGDVWCLPSGANAAAAAAGAAGPAAIAAAVGAGPAPAPIKCNSWDSKGRNPAMNIYVHLCPPGSAAGSSADEPPPRCKLGVLIQHALPRLAGRVGGYGQVALDWVTWTTDGDGTPLPCTVSPFGMPNPAHWLLLQELAKERETGAGTTTARAPQPHSAEERALRRAKDTLVAAAGFFGPDAVAKVSRLTVRKLYQREYHFFDEGGKDVADSRRHALEWAVGLAKVEEVLSQNPEARAKLNERLSVPNGGGSGACAGPARRKARASGGGSAGRRVLLSAARGSFPRAASGHFPEAAVAAAAAAFAAGAASAGLPSGVQAAQGTGADLSGMLPLPGSGAANQQQQQQQYLMCLLTQVQQQPQQALQQAQQAQQDMLQAAQQAAQPLQRSGSQPHLAPLSLPTLAAQQPLPAAQGQGTSQPLVSGQLPSLPAGLAHLPLQQHPAATAAPPSLPAGLSALPSAGGAGLSELLNTMQGPPSWLGPEVQLCPPAGREPDDDGACSPSLEVEQPSPARADPPAQMNPCREHPHPHQQQSDALHATQQHAAGQQPQTVPPPQQRVAGQQQPSAPPPPQPPQPQHTATLHRQQQQHLSASQHHQQHQQDLDLGLPAPSKRPRLEPQQHAGPGAATSTAVGGRLPLLLSGSQPSGRLGPAGQRGSTTGPGEEVVPLDAVLEAWEAHDRVNRQLSEAKEQLERQRQQLADAERQQDALQRQLATAQAQLSASAAQHAGGGSGLGSPKAGASASTPTAAATMAAAAAVQSQLAELRVLLPHSMRLQLTHMVPQHAELAPHAAAICNLASRAAEQVLASYASSLDSGAAGPSNPSHL